MSRVSLGDITDERHLQHPVVVPVRNEEATDDGLQRILKTLRNIDGNGRWMGDGERPDVRDDGEAVSVVDPVDADDVVRSDQRHQRVGRRTDEGNVHGPAELGRGKAAGERALAAARGIDPGDLAQGTFWDIERAVGADGAAKGALESGSEERAPVRPRLTGLGQGGGRGHGESEQRSRRHELAVHVRGSPFASSWC